MTLAQELANLDRTSKLDDQLRGHPDWPATEQRCRAIPVVLEMDPAAITDDRIYGFVWGWHLRDAFFYESLTGREGLAAQGLGAKVCVQTDLVTAWLVRRELGKFRSHIVAHRRRTVNRHNHSAGSWACPECED